MRLVIVILSLAAAAMAQPANNPAVLQAAADYPGCIEVRADGPSCPNIFTGDIAIDYVWECDGVGANKLCCKADSIPEYCFAN